MTFPAAGAPGVVSGGAGLGAVALLTLRQFRGIPIVTPREFELQLEN